jgi:hypothetical protein
MELLLNFAWLLLALPACWLWRRAEARPARQVSSLQSLLALGCALFLLFPVISASDDLHAMRAEIEESATSKRTARNASAEKSSGWVQRLQTLPATVATAAWLAAPEVEWFEVCAVRISPLARPAVIQVGRAPPFSFLG